MADEINDIVEDVIPVPELPQVKDGEEDKTDYKKFAEEAREIAEQNRGIAQRNKTRAERFKLANPAAKSDPAKPVSKSGELDYGQKAFLIANGVKDSDEVALVKDIMSNTGKSLDDVLESKYFQAELKEMRDTKKTEKATPPGTKRTGQSAADTVEYWLAKGELPPTSERKLRQDVVNARINQEKDKNHFTDNPVAGNSTRK